MKIQRVIPASLKLIPLAVAGVAVRVTKPIINPTKQVFRPSNTLHSPFLMGSCSILHYCISCANVKPEREFDLLI
jgi:hypothetical protein